MLRKLKLICYGIITITSWKGRINYTHITIESLLNVCKNFKIVLVLSTEEFPNKFNDLPKQLLHLCNNIDILWVDKNYKQFKKLLFTLNKYNNFPVITADDGCIYLKNFARELYLLWQKYPSSIISQAHWFNESVHFGSGGYGMLFPPNCFKHYGIKILEQNFDQLNKYGNDDAFIGCLAKELNIDIKFIKPLGEKNNNTIFKNIDECQINSLSMNNAYSESTILPIPDIVHNAMLKLQ